MKDFTVEINPTHKLIVSLNKLRKEEPRLASMSIKQLFDTSMLQSNLPISTKDYAKRTFNMLDMFIDQKLNVGASKEEDIKIERLSTE